MLTTVIRLTDQAGRNVLVRTDAFQLAMPCEGEQAAPVEGKPAGDPIRTVLITDTGANVYVTQDAAQVERMRLQALREMARLG